MPLKWREVIEKKEYKALPDFEKAKAKLEYFNDVVSHQVPEEEVLKVRGEFLKDAGLLEIERDKPSFIKDVVGETILKAPAKAAGLVIGAINSPLAFVWGSQQAQYLDKKQYDEMPTWKQTLVSIGGGIESMVESTFKEGKWGTMYGDYYKSVTGKTIEEDLPDSVKWSAPTIEFLANVASDPLIVTGIAKNLARFKIPKEWIGKIPEKVMSDIAKLEKMELAEKQVVQKKLVEALKNRADYMNWWENTEITPFEKAIDYIDRAKRPPIIESAKLPQAKGLGMEVSPRTKAEDITGLKTGKAIELPKRTGKTYFDTRQAALEKTAISPTIKQEPKAPFSGELEGLPGVSTKRDTLKPVFETKPSDLIKRTPQLEKATISRLPIAKATAGSAFGIETDEDGNVYYDIRKGALGAIGVGMGLKIIKHPAMATKKAKQFLSNYPAMTKVLSGIGKEKQIYTLPEVIQKANIKLFERFAPIKNVSPKTYEMTRKFQSYKDQALIKFRPLVEALNPVKKDNIIFTAYVKAHRDMVRAERGIKNPGSVKLAQAKQAIVESEQAWVAKGKKIDELKDSLDAYNQWTHDEMLYPVYKEGFISNEAYDSIVKHNKWYAAYDVIEQMPDDIDKIPILASSEYFSKSNQNIIKKMKGTEKIIADPIESTIRKFTLAQQSIARNKVASTLIDDPNMATLIRPIADSQKEFAIMKNQGKNPFIMGGVNKKEWGTINRFKDGRVERYAVPKEIADSMKQLSTYQAPKLVRAYNVIFKATATTLSPAFLVRNVFRDAILGYISSPYHGVVGAPKFAYDWGKGAWNVTKHVLGKESLVDDYIAHGGSFGWGGSEAFETGGKEAAKKMIFEKSLLRKSADVITSPFKLIEKANEIVEMAPRIGIFERGMKLGHTLGDAAMAGRQATIDFNRGGTWLKLVNQFIPFLNARVQAKVTLYDAFKRDWQGTSAKLMSTVMIPGMAAYAWNKLYHPDLYDDIPEYIRQDNFCLVYGKKIDEESGRVVPKYIAIPKGDAGTLFNPFEFALEAHFGDNPKSAKEFLINFLSDISPIEFAREGKVSLSKVGGSVTPPPVKPFLEDWANLRFYQGTEIVPYWMEKTKPPELQFKEATPEFYKWLGDKTKVSPLRLQNYMGNLFTAYGRVGFSPQAMGDVIKGALLKDTGGEQQAEAFKQIKSIEQGYNTMRAYAEEAVSQGDGGLANSLINEWNNGLSELIGKYNDRFEKHGFSDRGGLRKSYLITREKRRSILMKRESTLTPIEKRLTGRRK